MPLAPPAGNPFPARPSGVVILGGAHGSLALARSLGRIGVPVWLVSNDNPLPRLSRFFRGTYDWPGAGSPDAVPFLLDLARRQSMHGALLVAAADAEVQFASQAAEALAPVFKVILTPWDRLAQVVEKPLLYRLAAELGLGLPETWDARKLAAGQGPALRFPVILKPNMGGGTGPLARAKVMRIDREADFGPAFASACEEIGVGNVVVQELIPGGGACQFSYAALWHDGEAVAEYTARRTRQYPVDFGYTSTFVEVVEAPDVMAAARTLLTAIRHNGLVEIEFKRDPRDGSLRLLDVNPRPWSWFGLSAAAGVDLGAMMWAKACGQAVSPASAKPGAAWMYLVRDLVSAAVQTARGVQSPLSWLGDLARTRTWAAYAASDPMPGLAELPLTAWRVATRRVLKPLLARLSGKIDQRRVLSGFFKRRVKYAVIQAGLEAVALTRAGRIFPSAGGRGLIFTLHHVRPDAHHGYAPNGHLSVTPEFFAEAVETALESGLTPVALDDLPARLADSGDNRRFVCFTFDDGYRNNAEHALPVLHRFNVPATIFVTKGFAARTRSIWWETAEALTRIDRPLTLDLGGGLRQFPLENTGQRYAAFAEIARFVTETDEDAAVEALDAAALAHGIDPIGIVRSLVMDEDELRALSADPLIRLGAHTVTHVNLRRVSTDRLRAEVTESADEIERLAGYRPRAFSYPYGFEAAAGEREFEAARAAGFDIAVTTRPGILCPGIPGREMSVSRVSLNGHFQKRRHVRALISGVPFKIA